MSQDRVVELIRMSGKDDRQLDVHRIAYNGITFWKYKKFILEDFEYTLSGGRYEKH